MKRWRVEWHITMSDGTVDRGSKVFVKKTDGDTYKDHIEQYARSQKAQTHTTATLYARTQWFNYCQRYTPSTQYLYRMVIDAFIEYVGSVIIVDISAGRIQDYISHLLSNDRTARTANAHLTVIKSFCRWLETTYKLPNVSRVVKMLKEDPPQANFLTKDQYLKLRNSCEGPARSWVVFIANTGLRASEFVGLRWDNFDRVNKTITIIGKGRKRRTIGLNKTALAVLESTGPSNSSPIFMLKSKPLSRDLLYAHISRAGKTVGILTGPHALRHFFATRLLLAGVPIIKVSALLGHSSITTTQRHYSHILAPDLASVTDVLIE